MRWTVESDTARDVVSWPEEVDDFLTALRSDVRASRAACHADVPTGSLSARFEVSADSEDDAQAVARQIMLDALERAGLRLPDEPIVGITSERAVADGE